MFGPEKLLCTSLRVFVYKSHEFGPGIGTFALQPVVSGSLSLVSPRFFIKPNAFAWKGSLIVAKISIGLAYAKYFLRVALYYMRAVTGLVVPVAFHMLEKQAF